MSEPPITNHQSPVTAFGTNHQLPITAFGTNHESRITAFGTNHESPITVFDTSHVSQATYRDHGIEELEDFGVMTIATVEDSDNRPGINESGI